MNFSFLLLTADNTANIVGTVVGAIILVLLVGLLVYRYKTKPNGDQELEDFLSAIQVIVKDRIIEFIDKFDFETIKEDYANMQATLINGLYDDIWKLVEEEYEDVYNNEENAVLYKILNKLITREKIESYVNTIFAQEDIQQKLADLWNTALEKKNKEIEEEDAKLEKEAEEYETDKVSDEESDVEELDPTKLPGVEEEIIPPSEEESDTVDPDTVEIVETADVSENLSSGDDGEPV